MSDITAPVTKSNHDSRIAGRIAIVTGANRGIGRQFVNELLERGASKVYATARNPESADEGLRNDPRIELVKLDITDPTSVLAAAEQASDVSILVNNAGIATTMPLLTGNLDTIRLEMDTHFFGTLSVARAFAPALSNSKDGVMINVLSALSWFSYPGSGAYAAAKAAEWSLTNSLRLELEPHGVLVQGVHLGAADTDIMAGYEGPMIEPIVVARAALDGVEQKHIEVLVDEWSRSVKAALTGEPNAIVRNLLG
jgi:NAD(P)-dependent dehydrogenase (short-subunit alcohol dehydrogenase family)